VEEKNRSKYGERLLFGENVSYEDLDAMLQAGATMKTTVLTGEFTYEQYARQAGESRLPLMALDPGGRIYPAAGEGLAQKAKAGWKVLALVQGVANGRNGSAGGEGSADAPGKEQDRPAEQ